MVCSHVMNRESRPYDDVRLLPSATFLPFLAIWFVCCVDKRIYDDLDTNNGGASTDDGPTDGAPTDTGTCPSTLADRLIIHEVTVDEDIHYLRPGYNNIPQAARVILARKPDDGFVVAWQNADQNTIHVTPLTKTFARQGEDVVMAGVDLGGIVPRDDGFAVLTRQPDTGTPLAVEAEDSPAQAAVWVRYGYDDGVRSTIPLTGTDSEDMTLDYSNGLRGALRFDGSRYAAYFEIRGGLGDPRESAYGDKLVLVDDDGALQPGGWRFATGTLTGLCLIPVSEGFLALVFSDGQPEPGLNLIRSPGDTELLSREESWNGYSGGELGGAMVRPDGTTLIAWASRGFDETAGEAELDTHDVVLTSLDEDQRASGDIVRLTETPETDEINVHIAPYGTDAVLVIWNRIAPERCDVGTCFGDYLGASYQLFDAEGKPVTEEEAISAPPTEEQQMVQLDSTGVAFAFVTEAMDYSTSLDRLAPVPPSRTIRIAHLAYCDGERAP